MGKRLQGFIVGFLVCCLILGTTVFATGTTKTIKAVFNQVTVKIEGKLVNGDNIKYNGNVYVNTKNLATYLGKTHSVDKSGNVIIATKTNTTKRKIFGDLTDKEIQDAFKIGKSGFDKATSYMNDNYTLPVKSDTTVMLNSTATIQTPYEYFIGNTALADYKYEDYTLKEAKDFLTKYKKDNKLVINFDLSGTEINFHQKYSYVILQDGKKIKASTVAGSSDLADRTSSWPDFPAYSITITAMFDMNKIDFSKKAELVLVQLPEWEKHFTIDFSKYK